MCRYVGELLIGIGILHTLTGILGFRPTFAAIARDGVFDTIGGDVERQAALWFTLAGLMLVVLGLFMRWTLRRTGSLPRSLGWGVLSIAVIGIVLMPRSGFWSLVPVGLLAIVSAERGAPVPLADRPSVVK